MTDKEQILKLKDGERYIVPQSDYGKAEIWLKNDTYFLFEIPFLGGTPVFTNDYSAQYIDELIMEYESWT
jgi:hypothetical protein